MMLKYEIQDTAYSLTPFVIMGRNPLGHSWIVGWFESYMDAEKVMQHCRT